MAQYDGKITARGGRGADAPSATLTDPVYAEGMKLKDWVKIYGEEIVLSHFLSSRTIAIQKPMQSALKAGKSEQEACQAGAEKAKDLKAAARSGGVRKSVRKTRSEVEAEFAAKGFDVTDESVKAIIDGLFTK